MNMSNTLIPIGLGSLVVAAVWSWAGWADADRRAVAARANLTACEQLADRIESLRSRPALAGEGEMAMARLAGLVEQASATAELPDRGVTRIWPQRPRRIADTPYREHPTQVQMRGVSLKQLIRFLHDVTSRAEGLNVVSLRIEAPRDRDRAGRWDVETELGYLVYAPTGPAVTGD